MKRILSFLLCMGLIALHACKPEPDPYLTVSPDSLAFPQEGGAQTVRISANNAWTASVSGSGFSLSTNSGTGDATLTVTASPASATDASSGTLTVSSSGLSASVKLTQDAKIVLLVGDSAIIPAEGGSYEVNVQYNTDFTVEVEASAQSWITFVKTKALQNGKLEFMFAANENTEPRTGKVTVRDNAGKVTPLTITFIQEEKKVIHVGETTTIPAAGGSYEVDVQ